MKNKILASAASLFAALFISASAFAVEAIGGGSIRITLTPENAANLKVKIYSEGEETEHSIPSDEVLRLSTTNLVGVDAPKDNEFILEKYKEATGFVVMGDSDETLVQLTSEKTGINMPLHLDFQWYPKLRILTAAEKVEVLSESGEVLHELAAENPLSLSSAPGMAIRFTVLGADSGDAQVPADNNEDFVPAPNSGATGGCSLAANAGPNLGNAWMAILPIAFAAVRRFRPI